MQREPERERQDQDAWPQALSDAARELHQEWDSPHLWPQIRESLETAQSLRRNPGFRWRTSWAPLAAMLTLALLAGVGMWKSRGRSMPAASAPEQAAAARVFLNEQALREAEQAEQAYVRSIERLQALAEPDLRRTRSPLMASYSEKLRELDAAIDELRANVEDNRFHAHLRLELASLYQEKQRTLQEVLTNASN
jgi:hypothetical protein